VGVRRSREAGRRRRCRFNALVLTREGRRPDEALQEDEAGGSELVLAQWEGSMTRHGAW
jgi:hypothetical protein